VPEGTSGYTARKQAEVERKLTALDEEFQRWLAATSGVKPAFPKQHTQVRAVVSRLRGFQEAVRDMMAEHPSFSTAREMARTLLAIHRIWEFFRAKLAQRYETAFAGYLAVADEFAWLCAQPFYAKAKSQREPPLIFLNGGMSPFILTRDASFQAEAVPRELISGNSFKQAMASLPFPVIGVPWNQVSHLPDALAIGHEVGHSVEADFDLESTLDTLIDAGLKDSGGESRSALWKSWRAEVFADIYGCLSGGPAFVSALIDFLLADPDEIAARRPAMEAYPPENLRIRMNVCVLEKLGFADAGGALLSEWNATYPLPEDQANFITKDAPAIAVRILETKLDALGAPLQSVLTFTPDQHSKALTQAERVVQGFDFKDFRDLRVTLTAARLAYEKSPATFYTAKTGGSTADRFQERLKSHLTSDLRSGESRRKPPDQTVVDDLNVNLGKSQFRQIFGKF
jgi:hypothetical protein